MEKPLHNCRIVVTRTEKQAHDFLAALAALGATTFSFPTIAIEPLLNGANFWEAANTLHNFDTIIFTSENGVELFLHALNDGGYDVQSLQEKVIVAVGSVTAEALIQFGLIPDFTPKKFSAEGILELMNVNSLAGRRVLLPTAKVTREVLPQKLEELGAEVTHLAVYETVCFKRSPNQVAQMIEFRANFYTFTSPSTFENFLEILGEKAALDLLDKAQIACIGPVTGEAVTAKGLPKPILPLKSTASDLVEAIVKVITG